MTQRDLQSALSAPGLARLLAAARERLEKRGLDVGGVVVLQDPTPDERDAIASLLGLKRAGAETVRVPLRRLDDALKRSRFGAGLLDSLEQLDGPLVDAPARRASARAERDAFWERAHAHDTVRDRAALQAWVDDLRSTGLLARLGRREGNPSQLLERAFVVLGALPAAAVRLPVLAGSLFGDTHALDHGRALSAIVMRAIAAWAGRQPPVSAMQRRVLWAWAGVSCDDVSTDVLALNLRARGDDLLARTLRDFARAGEPVRITLRQLRSPVRLHGAVRVFVCENPALIAEAAERLGEECPAMVCVEGTPTTAAQLLLDQLVESRAQIAYHGDFDWSGLRIAAGVLGRPNALPWRFRASDYEDALTSSGPTIPLQGSAVDSPWDPNLARRMAGRGIALYEEQVMERLIGDLLDAR